MIILDRGQAFYVESLTFEDARLKPVKLLLEDKYFLPEAVLTDSVYASAWTYLSSLPTQELVESDWISAEEEQYD
jgi:hypothetical protein